SGTLVGPGTNKKLRPGIQSVLKEREKQSENRRLSLKVLGLRYSATPAPQPHGWVGASPPKVRGANPLPHTRRNRCTSPLALRSSRAICHAGTSPPPHP